MENDQVTLGGDQGQSGGGAADAQSLGWRAALPDEFKEHEYVKTFQKPGDFVKSALEIKTERDALKTRVDGAIFKPGENASPEERAAYLKALGVPDKPEGYEFSVPEGVPNDKAEAEFLRKLAHESGLPKEAGERFASAYFERMKSNLGAIRQQIETRRTEAVNALKGEWKDAYDAKLDAAKLAVRKIGGDDLVAWMNKTGMGDDPVMIRTWARIGEALSEASFHSGDGGKKDGPKRTDGGSPILSFPSMEK
jgi:hypothetical protein